MSGLVQLLFTSEKAVKFWKGAAIATGGALLTYVSGYDFGAATPFVAAAVSVLINGLKVGTGH